jgi:hypothetical protein
VLSALSSCKLPRPHLLKSARYTPASVMSVITMLLLAFSARPVSMKKWPMPDVDPRRSLSKAALSAEICVNLRPELDLPVNQETASFDVAAPVICPTRDRA